MAKNDGDIKFKDNDNNQCFDVCKATHVIFTILMVSLLAVLNDYHN